MRTASMLRYGVQCTCLGVKATAFHAERCDAGLSVSPRLFSLLFLHFHLYHYFVKCIYAICVRVLNLENFSDECLGSGYDEGRSELR